ncbi:unnamed protein product [Amoebophrya sp. A120]|nr:unnamed protein product [Amoebophrya sp. A120]|eukprot:GSA120T00008769001.1
MARSCSPLLDRAAPAPGAGLQQTASTLFLADEESLCQGQRRPRQDISISVPRTTSPAFVISGTAADSNTRAPSLNLLKDLYDRVGHDERIRISSIALDYTGKVENFGLLPLKQIFEIWTTPSSGRCEDPTTVVTRDSSSSDTRNTAGTSSSSPTCATTTASCSPTEDEATNLSVSEVGAASGDLLAGEASDVACPSPGAGGDPSGDAEGDMELSEPDGRRISTARESPNLLSDLPLPPSKDPPPPPPQHEHSHLRDQQKIQKTSTRGTATSSSSSSSRPQNKTQQQKLPPSRASQNLNQQAFWRDLRSLLDATGNDNFLLQYSNDENQNQQYLCVSTGFARCVLEKERVLFLGVQDELFQEFFRELQLLLSMSNNKNGCSFSAGTEDVLLPSGATADQNDSYAGRCNAFEDEQSCFPTPNSSTSNSTPFFRLVVEALLCATVKIERTKLEEISEKTTNGLADVIQSGNEDSILRLFPVKSAVADFGTRLQKIKTQLFYLEESHAAHSVVVGIGGTGSAGSSYLHSHGGTVHLHQGVATGATNFPVGGRESASSVSFGAAGGVLPPGGIVVPSRNSVIAGAATSALPTPTTVFKRHGHMLIPPPPSQLVIPALSNNVQPDFHLDPAGAAAQEQPAVSPLTQLEDLCRYYLLQISELCVQLEDLQLNIQETNQFLEASMDARRNQLLKMEVSLDIVSIVFGFGALISGIFGMNLKSGLEDTDGMFGLVISLIFVFGISIIGVCVVFYFKNKRNRVFLKICKKFGNSLSSRRLMELEMNAGGASSPKHGASRGTASGEVAMGSTSTTNSMTNSGGLFEQHTHGSNGLQMVVPSLSPTNWMQRQQSGGGAAAVEQQLLLRKRNTPPTTSSSRDKIEDACALAGTEFEMEIDESDFASPRNYHSEEQPPELQLPSGTSAASGVASASGASRYKRQNRPNNQCYFTRASTMVPPLNRELSANRAISS